MSKGCRYERPLVAQVEILEGTQVELTKALWTQFGKSAVTCLQSYGPKRYQVSFSSMEVLQRVLEVGICVVGQRVFPEPLKDPARWITVRYAPYEMPKDDIVKCLAPFGEVIQQEFVIPKEIAPISNGNRRVRIRMTKPVPNFVKWGPYTLMCTYAGVIKTCRRCGMEGHLAEVCTKFFCFGCGKPDHKLRDCPVRSQPVVEDEGEKNENAVTEESETSRQEIETDEDNLSKDRQDDETREETGKSGTDEEMEDSMACKTPETKVPSSSMTEGTGSLVPLSKVPRKEETSSSEQSDSSVISVKKQATTDRRRIVIQYKDVAYDKFREAVLLFFGDSLVRAKWLGKTAICIEYRGDSTYEDQATSSGILVKDKKLFPIPWDVSCIFSDDEEKAPTKKGNKRRSRKFRNGTPRQSFNMDSQCEHSK